MITVNNIKNKLKDKLLKVHPAFYDIWMHKINKLDQGTIDKAFVSLNTNAHNISLPKYKNVLIFTQRYWKFHAGIEFLLARSLINNGYNVTILICDKAVNTCDNDVLENKKIVTHMCSHCSYLLKKLANRFEINLVSMREYMISNNLYCSVDKSAKLKTYKEYVFTSWRRLCRSVNVLSDKEYQLEQNLIESISVYDVFFEHYLRNTNFDKVIMLNGRFFAERALAEYCKKLEIAFITYEIGQLENSIIIEKNDFVVPYRIEQNFKDLLEQPLTKIEEQTIDKYMLSRESNMHTSNNTNINDIINKETLKNNRVFSLFSNVIWDSAVIDRHTIFPNMYKWIEKTINCIKKVPDSILIIRTHPDEVKLSASQFKTREKMVDFLANIDIPPNVHIISSEQNINSYSIIKHTDVGLVYTSTIGLEMAYRGLPLIVCGNTHYLNQDFVYSPASITEYESLLKSPSLHTTYNQRQKAKKYSYILFFKYHKKLKGIKKFIGKFEYTNDRNNLLELFGFN